MAPSTNWTDERIETLTRLWCAGMSATQIAVRLGGGLTRNAVIGKIHRLQISRPSKWDRLSEDERVAELRRLTARQYSRSEIARHFGTTPHMVCSWCERFGIDSASQKGRLKVWVPQKAPSNVAPLLVPQPSDDLTPLAAMSEVRERQCRHIPGDAADDDPAMCGRPVPEGSEFSFCEHHAAKFLRGVSSAATSAVNITA